MLGAQVLLVLGVVGVGVLHTAVPDHWLPIALLARQRGWTRAETARAALQAGGGHVVTTLLLGVLVWIVGATASARFGEIIDIAASLALVGFGIWIAAGAWREMHAGANHHHGDHEEPHGHAHPHPHQHEHRRHHEHGHLSGQPWEERDPLYDAGRRMQVSERHAHLHRHGNGPVHMHWHAHDAASAHGVDAQTAAVAPLHVHRHGTSGRMALLLVLGSSPMVEGIPAFLAASRYGAGYIAILSVAFAASTIATYVVLSVYSATGLQRFNLGPLERYGEVLSGILMAAIGVGFGLTTII